MDSRACIHISYLYYLCVSVCALLTYKSYLIYSVYNILQTATLRNRC